MRNQPAHQKDFIHAVLRVLLPKCVCSVIQSSTPDPVRLPTQEMNLKKILSVDGRTSKNGKEKNLDHERYCGNKRRRVVASTTSAQWAGKWVNIQPTPLPSSLPPHHYPPPPSKKKKKSPSKKSVQNPISEWTKQEVSIRTPKAHSSSETKLEIKA